MVMRWYFDLVFLCET